MTLLLCALAAGAYVCGGAFMRRAAGFSRALPSVMVFVCFGVGAALQTLSLRRSELSVNYVVVLGFEAGLAIVAGVGWLGEPLSARKLAGLALIIAGILSLRLEERPQPVPTATVLGSSGACETGLPGDALRGRSSRGMAGRCGNRR